jgi:hypothetical protein
VKPYQRVERIIRDIPASRDPAKPNYVVAGIHGPGRQGAMSRPLGFP